MDWLHQVRGAVEKKIFRQVANLLNREVDLLFFDITSTYFEADEEDEPLPRDKNGHVTDDEQQAAGGKPALFRAYGKSKDHRDGLSQIVTGIAVTRDGIPGADLVLAGSADDSAAPGQVKDDMRDWALSRIVWVADRGFTSAKDRRYLWQGDHHCIIGGKLRSGSAEAAAAPSRQGPYRDVAANLRVKEVRISDSEHRFNPEEAAPTSSCAGLPCCSSRIAETTTGLTWAKIADELDLLTLGTFTGPAGTFRQTAELTKTQRDLFAKLKIPCPKKIIEVNPSP